MKSINNIEIKLNNTCINEILDGGFKGGNLYHIYGEDGSGKTTLCLYISYLLGLKNYKTLYIDTTNKINLIRLKQIANKDFYQISSLLFIQTPKSFKELDEIINKLEFFITDKFKLIVIDDIRSLYVLENKSSKNQILRMQMISRQLALLKNISRSYNNIVFIVNNITSRKSQENSELSNLNIYPLPFLKSITTFYSDYDLLINIFDPKSFNEREIVLVKPNKTNKIIKCRFKLTYKGIE